jgi:hypothetical protein
VSKLDPLLMRADIARVEDERPDLDHTIVRGLYEHFVDVRGRQPDLDEFREYVDRITSSIEWLDLHQWFSPHEPTTEERAALLDGFGRGLAAGTAAEGRRRPGRPKGSRSTSRQQIVGAYRSLRTRYGRAPTQGELASNLEPPIARRALQAHLKEYGLPWPPE